MPVRSQLCVILFVALAFVPVRADPPAEPEVSAKAWAVADGATGKLLWGGNETESRPIASTTKIMTAWIVLRLAEDEPKVLDEIVTFSERAAKTRGSSAKLKLGETLPVRELLYGLMLPSGNDAAVALAEHFSPRFKAKGETEEDTVKPFIGEMNRLTKALDLKETSYLDPNGLSSSNKSSARDLAMLASKAMQNERFRGYVLTKSHKYDVTGPNGEKRSVSWTNTNKLLGTEGFDGVKTGTTTPAGACLVASGHRGTDRLIAVILGAKTGDGRYDDARALFEWAWQKRGQKAELPPKAVDEPNFTRKEDVIYGRKYGTALTLDVFAPKQNANGAAVIWVVSGGWFSGHEAVPVPTKHFAAREFVNRGYTVFAVVHGSQPRFTIPEILQDMNRAVRYIRSHAEEYKIDPNRIGITGGSAGGHLSLMQGTAGTAGNPKAADPVEKASSRVQAVACFFPPTDFLNYGSPGENGIGRGRLKGFAAPFAFSDLDPMRHVFVPVTDEEKILEIGRKISPVTHVTAESPPTLIIHGDKDELVPLQQAEVIIAKLKAAGVPCELIVKPGAGHGWANIDKDTVKLADWMDRYLKKE